MGCCHMYAPVEGGDGAFTVEPSRITFGEGCLREAGDFARFYQMSKVALFTDKMLSELEHVSIVVRSLREAGVDVEIYDEVRVEPTDQSFLKAAEFAKSGDFDGYFSVGGGSVIDTCKAANLYASYPADFLTYVNAPIGEGKPVPGELKPHIACPTTSGTGSECTGIAVFDLLSMKAKTGIASKKLKPTHALVDPSCTYTLPSSVVASSAFDVLSHALESFTARPYTARPAPHRPSMRPMSQGANPWSDMGCREALQLLGKYLSRAVDSADDKEARTQLMWASTLAGIAFGNSGVHLPHGMAYSVAGLVKDFYPVDYPQGEAMVPHGMSVIVNAPSVFRYTANTSPQRHLDAASWLGADITGAGLDDAGEVLAQQLIHLMQVCQIPNGLCGVGYCSHDIPALTEGALPQKRLLDNAPCKVDGEVLSHLYQQAISYW